MRQDIEGYLKMVKTQTAQEVFDDTEAICRKNNSKNSFEQKPNRQDKKRTIRFLEKESKRAKPWDNKYSHKLDKIKDRLRLKIYNRNRTRTNTEMEKNGFVMTRSCAQYDTWEKILKNKNFSN